MENFERKKHWENIYQTKELKAVSWFQQTPETSLEFFKRFNVPTTSKDIDIRGDESFLIDQLLVIKRVGKTQMARRATHNSTYKKLAVQCLHEALCFESSSLEEANFRASKTPTSCSYKTVGSKHKKTHE